MNVQSGTFANKGGTLKKRFYTIQMLCLYTLHFVFYRTWQACEDILFAVLPQNVRWRLWCDYQDTYLTQALDNAVMRIDSKRKRGFVRPTYKVGFWRMNTLHSLYVNEKLKGKKYSYKDYRFWPYRNWKREEQRELYNT